MSGQHEESGGQSETSVSLGSALPEGARQKLEELFERLQPSAETLVGYPCNQVFDYSELNPFLAYTLNNIGDPFADSNFRLNSHDIEREVVARFARYAAAPQDGFWGYVTGGGTEGNLYGLYLARELNPSGIVYYSEDTHYSVAKSLKLLGVRSIMIRSQDNGEMDYADLEELLRIHRDVPPIVFANIGTTMKGAIDNVARVRALLEKLRLQDAYVHCDCALSGMILPFVEDPPPWNFSAGADSISISGHKMIGSPLPCGVVLAKKHNVERIARSVEYVGVLDTTIGGSRNGFTPLILYYALERMGDEGFRQVVQRCLATAAYATRRFQELGIEAWRNPASVTVVFPRPSDEVVRKWQIAPYKGIGHLITMPHVTEELVEALLADYLALPPQRLVRCAVSSPGSRAVAGGETP